MSNQLRASVSESQPQPAARARGQLEPAAGPAPTRMVAGGPVTAPAMLHLQRVYGNRFVQRVVAASHVAHKAVGVAKEETFVQRAIRANPATSGVDQRGIAEFRRLIEQYQALLQSGTLSREEIDEVNQAIARAEAALREAERVSAAGSSLGAGAAVALGASAVLVADDATVVGVADDVALPFTLAAAGILALGAWIARSSAADIQRTGDAARDAVAQAVRAIGQILLAQRVGDQVRGLSVQVVIHLARILGTTVSGQPPDHQGDPERDRPHWWTEIKNWIRQISDKGLSPKQLLRELRRRFSDEQLREIRDAIREAARRMGEDPPDFPPTVAP